MPFPVNNDISMRDLVCLVYDIEQVVWTFYIRAVQASRYMASEGEGATSREIL